MVKEKRRLILRIFNFWSTPLTRLSRPDELLPSPTHMDSTSSRNTNGHFMSISKLNSKPIWKSLITRSKILISSISISIRPNWGARRTTDSIRIFMSSRPILRIWPKCSIRTSRKLQKSYRRTSRIFRSPRTGTSRWRRRSSLNLSIGNVGTALLPTIREMGSVKCVGIRKEF